MNLMETDSFSDDQIRDILSLKKVVVVGMSQFPHKDAHLVPKYLIKNNYEVIPVNPNTDKILERKSYPETSTVPGEIDIVDVFRPSDQVLPIIQDAIKKNPKVIWLQEGIHNIEAEELARKQGIKVVFNRCMLAEHRRLFLD